MIHGAHMASDLGGAEGTRTPDPLVANEVRYQLRHSPGWSIHTRQPAENDNTGQTLTAALEPGTHLP
jgi:hypothetical protein